MITHLFQALEMVQRGALFVVNHSGGKDSQAMLAEVRAIVPDSQILVVHASLGRIEWEGTIEHIQATIGNLPLVVVKAEKDFLSMARDRGMFASPKYRQCTSDLKRGPIEKAIRQYLKAHPEFGGLVVSCEGMRAEESSARSKLHTWEKHTKQSIAGREWFKWLPLHNFTVDQVWETIRCAGQEPHWAYSKGMSRLSCCFCIMASKADLRTAAIHNPDLYREYVQTERDLGFSLIMPAKGQAPRFLEEITGIAA